MNPMASALVVIVLSAAGCAALQALGVSAPAVYWLVGICSGVLALIQLIADLF